MSKTRFALSAAPLAILVLSLLLSGESAVVSILSKKRHYVISTGTSGNPFYIKSKRAVGLRICTRRLRLLAATRKRRCSRWLYDTGASICITGDISILRGVHNDVHMHSRGVSGTELVSNKCGHISGRVKLSGIRYFPGAKVNLISGGLLGSLGCETTQNAKGCKIIKDGQVILALKN